MLLSINRSSPFDPEVLLSQSGFKVEEEDVASLKLGEIDTEKIHLVYTHQSKPLFQHERISVLRERNLVMIDGKILESIVQAKAFAESWKHVGADGNPVPIHFDGTVLRSTWDGRRFGMYALYNPVQKIWETPYLGPWAGFGLSAVLEA
jgi:hypothetical protein